jgi:hypothetical protein
MADLRAHEYKESTIHVLAYSALTICVAGTSSRSTACVLTATICEVYSWHGRPRSVGGAYSAGVLLSHLADLAEGPGPKPAGVLVVGLDALEADEMLRNTHGVDRRHLFAGVASSVPR